MSPTEDVTAKNFVESQLAELQAKEYLEKYEAYNYAPCIRGTTEYYDRAIKRREHAADLADVQIDINSPEYEHLADASWEIMFEGAALLQNSEDMPAAVGILEDMSASLGELGHNLAEGWVESLKLKARDEICDALFIGGDYKEVLDVLQASTEWKSIRDVGEWIESNFLSSDDSVDVQHNGQSLFAQGRDIFTSQIFSEKIKRNQE